MKRCAGEHAVPHAVLLIAITLIMLGKLRLHSEPTESTRLDFQVLHCKYKCGTMPLDNSRLKLLFGPS